MQDNTRLVQLSHNKGRRVAFVKEPYLVLLADTASIYQLADDTLQSDKDLLTIIQERLTDEKISYDEVYEGRSDWKLLPSFDVPGQPLQCLVAGTGLTHKNSALNRQMMHEAAKAEATDSMKMYQWGVEGGWPAAGSIGVQPEWFYKGTGDILRAHLEPLTVPNFANDGGEEPEIAGVYIVDKTGQPHRIGFTTANEFSDHVMEKKNYLYLAPSKLRNCSIGPELVIDQSFTQLRGNVSIYRNGKLQWSSVVNTGEQHMAHSLANLEYHHFKYEGHRIPGQAHVHFFGADAFSFGSGLALEEADVMQVQWNGMGRALRNPVHFDNAKEKLLTVAPMFTSNKAGVNV